MRPILGGHVPPNRVIGRDSFIRDMWNTLENDSIVLTAERRIGKTSVIYKMYKEPQEGWRPIFQVIEGVRSPEEFISKILDMVTPILSKKGKLLSKTQQFYSSIAGAKLGNWEIPLIKTNWKKILSLVFEDIIQNFEEKIVFFWDELPLMISNIKSDHGEKAAMELLDVLRDFRVMDDTGKLRMVYTGSIGLHLVVSELISSGYRNDPTNDMVTYSLGALKKDNALNLARSGIEGLIKDNEITLKNNIEEMSKIIAEKTDGIPFYINHVVNGLIKEKMPIDIGSIENVLTELISDPEDKAHFGHYAERIFVYYNFHEKSRELASCILDEISRCAEAQDENTLLNTIKHKIELKNGDISLFKQTLSLLQKDHYLRREDVNELRKYRFQYGIIKKWWLKNRG